MYGFGNGGNPPPQLPLYQQQGGAPQQRPLPLQGQPGALQGHPPAGHLFAGNPTGAPTSYLPMGPGLLPVTRTYMQAPGFAPAQYPPGTMHYGTIQGQAYQQQTYQQTPPQKTPAQKTPPQYTAPSTTQPQVVLPPASAAGGYQPGSTTFQGVHGSTQTHTYTNPAPIQPAASTTTTTYSYTVQQPAAQPVLPTGGDVDMGGATSTTTTTAAPTAPVWDPQAAAAAAAASAAAATGASHRAHAALQGTNTTTTAPTTTTTTTAPPPPAAPTTQPSGAAAETTDGDVDMTGRDSPARAAVSTIAPPPATPSGAQKKTRLASELSSEEALATLRRSATPNHQAQRLQARAQSDKSGRRRSSVTAQGSPNGRDGRVPVSSLTAPQLAGLMGSPAHNGGQGLQNNMVHNFQKFTTAAVEFAISTAGLVSAGGGDLAQEVIDRLGVDALVKAPSETLDVYDELQADVSSRINDDAQIKAVSNYQTLAVDQRDNIVEILEKVPIKHPIKYPVEDPAAGEESAATEGAEETAKEEETEEYVKLGKYKPIQDGKLLDTLKSLNHGAPLLIVGVDSDEAKAKLLAMEGGVEASKLLKNQIDGVNITAVYAAQQWGKDQAAETYVGIEADKEFCPALKRRHMDFSSLPAPKTPGIPSSPVEWRPYQNVKPLTDQAFWHCIDSQQLLSVRFKKGNFVVFRATWDVLKQDKSYETRDNGPSKPDVVDGPTIYKDRHMSEFAVLASLRPSTNTYGPDHGLHTDLLLFAVCVCLGLAFAVLNNANSETPSAWTTVTSVASMNDLPPHCASVLSKLLATDSLENYARRVGEATDETGNVFALESTLDFHCAARFLIDVQTGAITLQQKTPASA